VLLLACAAGTVAAEAVIADVATSPGFFNPSLGQRQGITFRVDRPGLLTVEILDRDRFRVRSWRMEVAAGPVSASWDGRDDQGEVVPDEAYNLRLTLDGGGAGDVYDPSAGFEPVPVDARVDFFSAANGVLGYTLVAPSRVHAQAGQARRDPRSQGMEGPVLKTLVDNGPRVAGPVVEKWNGLDEGGTIAVPPLPDFVVAVLATPLPPAAMIAVGNRARTFFDYARARRPAASTKPRDLRASTMHHHRGLTALEDRTPPLEVVPAGEWDASGRRWQVRSPLAVTVTVKGDGAPYFLAQPTVLSVFVDGERRRQLPQPDNPVTVTLSAAELPPGAHLVAFNWGSLLGPTAVGAVSVQVADGSQVLKGGS